MPFSERKNTSRLSVVSETSRTANAIASAVTATPLSAPETRVVFVSSIDGVEYGEAVAVVGSDPSIGQWDVSKALTLTTHDAIFPSWILEDSVTMLTGTEVEYKYIVVSKDGSFRRWEQYDGNRIFRATGKDMVIEDDFGNYRNHCEGSSEEENESDHQEELVSGVSGNLRSASLVAQPEAVRNSALVQKMKEIGELEEDVKLDPERDEVLMVALRLPIQIVRDKNGWKVASDQDAPSDGRNFAFVPVMNEFREKRKITVKCIGWPGVHVTKSTEQKEIIRLLKPHNCIPIFPAPDKFNKFLEFCTQFLWPVFHDVMLNWQSSNPHAFDIDAWKEYQQINMFYGNEVSKQIHNQENCLVWVHDYHLMLVPTWISRKQKLANIGFYLHKPFPSSDSFRTLPIRDELLDGLLCADQLGFQFSPYARNFLVAVKRIKGLDLMYRPGGFMYLDYMGRKVNLVILHFVYPFANAVAVVDTPIVHEKTQQVKTLFQGKAIFASMDRCDNLSGLIPKFRAFREFVEKRKEYQGKVVLVQYLFDLVPDIASVAALLASLRCYADGFVKVDEKGNLSITTKEDGCRPEECHILLREEHVDRVERLALFRAANFLLDTSVKAGLNLMPFEFTAANYDNAANHAVPIISEFSGCSRVILGSIRVNPWNIAELANACHEVLKMREDKKAHLFEANLEYVSNGSCVGWFDYFLTDLRRYRKTSDTHIERIGFGSRTKQVVMSQKWVNLPHDAVLNDYRSAKSRVFFFDVEGTLTADNRDMYRTYGQLGEKSSDLTPSHGSAPSKDVMDVLRTISQDENNTVFVLSAT